MTSLVCGRCGNHTLPKSTYCTTCRWTIYVDAPDVVSLAQVPAPLAQPQLHGGGFLARRRQEGEIAHLENEFRRILDSQIEEAEAQLEDNPNDAVLQRRMGLLALLDDAPARANAHFEHAHKLAPDDLETHVNYGITLARRGQYQPAILILEEAHLKWPQQPGILFNLALAALGARRPQRVLDAVEALENLWQNDPSLVADYHDSSLTLRGLALLLQGRHWEAFEALNTAARHKIHPEETQSTQDGKKSTLDGDKEKLQSAESREGNAGDAKNADKAAADEGIDAIPYVEKDEEDENDESLAADVIIEEDEVDLLAGLEEAGADMLNNLALAEAAQGYPGRAASLLSAALRADPAHTPALSNLGVLAYNIGQHQTALKYLQVARRVEQSGGQPEPAIFNHLGSVLAALGQLDDALEQFEHAGSHEHAEFEVFYNLGRAYIERGNPDKGIGHLRHAFQIEPNHADLHALLGVAYLLRGRKNLLPEALKHLKRALQLNPRHATSFANLITTLRELDQQEATLQALRSAVKSFPEHPAILFQLAVSTILQGDEENWARAGTQFGKVYVKRPDITAALFDEALAQYMLGLRDAASTQLERAVQRDIAFAPAYYLIGMGHAMASRWDEALVAWKKALNYEPTNVDVLTNVGFVYFQREDFRSAVRYFTLAHQILPSHDGILASLGLSFARAGMLPQAITAFQQSLRLNNLSPVTHSNLGLAYYLFKQVDKAMEEWRMVSQLDAGYASRREEEQYRVYDNSIVEIHPFNWQSRVIMLSPPLPLPHTRLLPGYNARAYRLVINDRALQKVAGMKKELDYHNRLLASMNVK